MRDSTSVFLTSVHQVSLKYNQPLYLQPFGDIHHDSPMHATDRFNNDVTSWKRADKGNVLYIGMGDINDVASSSERKMLAHPDVHDTSAHKLDKMAKRDSDEVIKKLAFMKGSLLGLLEGNHKWVFQTHCEDDEATGGWVKGETSTQYMCRQLACPWLGGLAYVHVAITMSATTRYSFSVMAHHGKAGGKLMGTTINQVVDLERICPDADIYLMGHDHRAGCLPDARLRMAYNTKTGKVDVKERKRFFGRTGSYLRGYAEGRESYQVGALYAPSVIGSIRFQIDIIRKRERGKSSLNLDIKGTA